MLTWSWCIICYRICITLSFLFSSFFFFLYFYFVFFFFFFFQAEDGIRDWSVTGVQTCALPISSARGRAGGRGLDVRRRRRHPPAARLPAPGGRDRVRRAGAAAVRADRPPEGARRLGGRRLRARRRKRAADGLRLAGGRRARPAWAAGDRPARDPRLRRHPDAAATGGAPGATRRRPDVHAARGRAGDAARRAAPLGGPRAGAGQRRRGRAG